MFVKIRNKRSVYMFVKFVIKLWVYKKKKFTTHQSPLIEQWMCRSAFA